MTYALPTLSSRCCSHSRNPQVDTACAGKTNCNRGTHGLRNANCSRCCADCRWPLLWPLPVILRRPLLPLVTAGPLQPWYALPPQSLLLMQQAFGGGGVGDRG